VPAQDDDFGEVRLQSVVPKLANHPGKVRHTARSIGADNETIYKEFLDLDPADLVELKEKNII
ncbi:MAG: CoA transferase, partial [Alphaproteobacteria bacterium]|nr:CoA transferase [Alphaproteobacteria bacterium]